MRENPWIFTESIDLMETMDFFCSIHKKFVILQSQFEGLTEAPPAAHRRRQSGQALQENDNKHRTDNCIYPTK